MGFRSSLETAVLVAPILAVYGAVAYGLRRQRGHDHAGLRTARDLALGVALTGIGVFTLLPGPSRAPLAVELIPFRSMYLNLRGDAGYGITVMVANIALFVPVGFALRWFRLRVRHAALAATGLGVLVEVLQWSVIGGRVISSDDVLLNMVGGVIGAGVASAVLPARLAPSPPDSTTTESSMHG